MKCSPKFLFFFNFVPLLLNVWFRPCGSNLCAYTSQRMKSQELAKQDSKGLEKQVNKVILLNYLNQVQFMDIPHLP